MQKNDLVEGVRNEGDAAGKTRNPRYLPNVEFIIEIISSSKAYNLVKDFLGDVRHIHGVR